MGALFTPPVQMQVPLNQNAGSNVLRTFEENQGIVVSKHKISRTLEAARLEFRDFVSFGNLH